MIAIIILLSLIVIGQGISIYFKIKHHKVESKLLVGIYGAIRRQRSGYGYEITTNLNAIWEAMHKTGEPYPIFEPDGNGGLREVVSDDKF